MTTLVRDRIDADQIKPLDGRVLVRRAIRPEKSRGGIYLPDMTRNISQTGVVLKVAEYGSKDCPHCAKRLAFPPDVREGDVIVFSQYAALPIVATDEDLVMVRERDILAVVES